MKEVYKTRIGLAFDETLKDVGHYLEMTKRGIETGDVDEMCNILPLVMGIIASPLLFLEDYADSFRIPYSPEKSGYVYDTAAFRYQ
ncbi:MAG: hypothetical protein HY518_03875 [Candidatus Aenigmarchaeota archaeon]|nr:hypothetical protein [Candidatus Aenigmarchaeota archaeon]